MVYFVTCDLEWMTQEFVFDARGPSSRLLLEEACTDEGLESALPP